MVDARSRYDQLLSTRGAPLSPDTATSLSAQGKQNQTLGWALIGVAGVGVAASIIWWLLDRPAPAETAWLSRDGAGIAFAGAWP